MRSFSALLLAICLAFVSGRRHPMSAIPRGGARVSNNNSPVAAVSIASSNSPGPIQTFVSIVKDARRHLAAAAVARATSIFAMYPIDTIKTRIQMEQKNAMRLAGIYSGVGGSLLGQVPYGVLTFGSYEVYKQNLLETLPKVKPVFLYAAAAILGDVTGSGWLCPSEVVKQKLQAGMYSSTGAAIQDIWKTKGWSGFYEGYFGGLARDVPFRVAQLTSYEVSKKIFLQWKKTKQQHASVTNVQLSPGETAAVGALAGSFSAAITSPLDRIKTLLMTDSAAYGGNVASCAAQIWREEGMAGFCQGVVPRVVYIAPSVMIFFIAYEQVQQRLRPDDNGI